MGTGCMATTEQTEGTEGPPLAKASSQALRRGRGRGRGPGPKRVAFQAALKDLLQSGDVRMFSEGERERNVAASQAAATLPTSLSRGPAHRYVVQALPRLKKSGTLYK